MANTTNDDDESNNKRPDHVPPEFVLAGLPYWHSTAEYPTKPLPTRQDDDDDDRHCCLCFDDYPTFRPNLTPKEIIQAGSFGGTYFRPIVSQTTRRSYKVGVHLEFPPDWFHSSTIDGGRKKDRSDELLTSTTYNKNMNKYGVKSGNDLNFWENKGWMRSQDPYGWFQWYCRFYLGRRTEDDDRQVSRWIKAIGPNGRWRTFLVGQCIKQGKTFDDVTASPVTRQTLLHWGYELTKDEFDRIAGPIINEGKTVIYMGKIPLPASSSSSGNRITDTTTSTSTSTRRKSVGVTTRKSKRRRKKL